MNQSFFHKVNDGLTINLADVQFAEDRSRHYSSLPDNEACARFVAEGRVFCIGMREGSTVHGARYGGQQFNITAKEFRAVQDGLEWYSNNIANQPR